MAVPLFSFPVSGSLAPQRACGLVQLLVWGHPAAVPALHPVAGERHEMFTPATLFRMTAESLLLAYGDLNAADAGRLDLACESLGIGVDSLMEMAGEQVARAAWMMLGEKPGAVAVVAGRGNNGGDGLVAARNLAAWGCSVRLQLVAESEELISARIAGRLSPLRVLCEQVVVAPALQLSGEHDIIIDALFGTGLKQSPRPAEASVIAWMAGSGSQVLCVDVPSGLDTTTGAWLAGKWPCQAVCCLAAAKHGVWVARDAGDLESIWVADIGVPRMVWDQLALQPPLNVVAGSLSHIPR